jgi:hypothetical protein
MGVYNNLISELHRFLRWKKIYLRRARYFQKKDDWAGGFEDAGVWRTVTSPTSPTSER